MIITFRALPRPSLHRLAAPVGAAALAALCACSAPTQPASLTSVAASPTTPPITGPAGTSVPSPGPAAQKVNANTASRDQVAQALAANGVPNASRWAAEVVEYRPYPTDDPSFAKLRQELAKYNPAPGVTDEIVASLTLS